MINFLSSRGVFLYLSMCSSVFFTFLYKSSYSSPNLQRISIMKISIMNIEENLADSTFDLIFFKQNGHHITCVRLNRGHHIKKSMSPL